MSDEEFYILLEFMETKSKFPDYDLVSKTFGLSIEELCDLLYGTDNKIIRKCEYSENRKVRYNSYTEKVILTFNKDYMGGDGWSLQINEVGGERYNQNSDE